MHFIGHHGIRLAADAFGDAARTPVVLFHGGGQTRHAWDETAASLVRLGFHVVTIDHRGHGDSEWPEDGDYTLDAFAGDVAAVARTFADKPILVGASLGGVAAMVAEAEEHVARALVLVDVAPRMEPEGVAKIVGFMRANPDGFASLEAARDAVAAYLPNRPRPADLSGLAKNLRRSDDGRYRWHWDPRLLDGEKPIEASKSHTRLAAAARALSVPTLLVRGEKSDLLSPEGVREFLSLAPHASFVDVADAGHMVAGDSNDAFTRAIAGFLANV